MSYSTKKGYVKKSPEAIQEEIKQQTEHMMKHVESYVNDPEKIKEVLRFMKEFHTYSFKNQQMIQSQFQGAQAVGSFKYFKDRGYFVKKGEKGIKVFVPTPIKSFQKTNGTWANVSSASKEEKGLISKGVLKTKEAMVFKLGSVFDISQTNAPEDKIPELFPNKHVSYKNGYPVELEDALHDLAKEMNIPVRTNTIGGDEELGASFGQYRRMQLEDGSIVAEEIVLNHRNTPSENVKVLIHELAHAHLHANTTKSTEVKETEAELTAYVVANHFDLDTSETSLNYIAGWSKNGQALQDKVTVLEDVSKTSSFFIAHLGENIQKQTLQMKPTQSPSHTH